MSNERTASALGSDPEELSPTASGELDELREANTQLFEIGQKQHRQIQADDYTIRRMQAALRCARGWLITCSESATARADLKTLDAALERSPPPATPPPALNWRPDREAVASAIAAYQTERERWTLRRDIDKSGWNAVRIDANEPTPYHLDSIDLGPAELQAHADFDQMVWERSVDAAFEILALPSQPQTEGEG